MHEWLAPDQLDGGPSLRKYSAMNCESAQIGRKLLRARVHGTFIPCLRCTRRSAPEPNHEQTCPQRRFPSVATGSFLRHVENAPFNACVRAEGDTADL